MLDVAAYLARIGYAGGTAPTSETLRALHRAHLFSVPFENLDIHTGQPIVLEEDRLVRKIVQDRRGGFCYELNGAFGALLAELGFAVDRLAAGVMGEGGFGPPFDHLLLAVTAADRQDPWLVDVGFGDGFVDPLRFAPGEDQVQPTGTYRVDAALDGPPQDLVLTRRVGRDGAAEPQYRFDLAAHGLAEYAAMCRFHQTSADSHFTRQRVCSVATRDGRLTLSEHAMIRTVGGERTIRKVRGDAAYREALRDAFGIVLDAPWVSPPGAG